MYARCRPGRRAPGGDDERGRGRPALRAGPEGAPVSRAGIHVGGGAPGCRRRGRVPVGARRRGSAARMAGVARQLHVLDRAGAGAGRVRRDPETRQGTLVRTRHPARRSGGRVPVALAGVVPGAGRRPGAHLRLAARAASRSGELADGEVFLRTERPDLSAPRVVVVAVRAARRGTRHPRAGPGRPAGGSAGRPRCHHARRGRPGRLLRVRLQPAGVRPDHVARAQMGEQPVRRVYFMGCFLAALMGLAVLAIAVRRRMGLEALISPRQLHDLGKLCFGFTVFWAYLMWAQFLVIWYGNLPEETYFIFYRLIGSWKPVGVWVFLLVFVVPFIGLLGVKPKKHAPTFVTFALLSLAGTWLERYLEIVPSINGGVGPAIGLPETASTLLFGGLFLLSYGWFGGRYPMLSPRLAADALERERH